MTKKKTQMTITYDYFCSDIKITVLVIINELILLRLVVTCL